MTIKNLDKLIAQYIDAKKEAEKAKKEADALKSAILAELDRRDVDTIDTGTHTAKRTTSEARRIDTTALRADLPEIWIEYGKTYVTVRLTVK